MQKTQRQINSKRMSRGLLRTGFSQVDPFNPVSDTCWSKKEDSSTLKTKVVKPTKRNVRNHSQVFPKTSRQKNWRSQKSKLGGFKKSLQRNCKISS